jgi:cyclohexadienyl dehydratase
VVTLGAACGATPPPAVPSSSPDLSYITKQRSVRVCSTGDYRPFSYLDPQGHWSGMDIDLAQDLAKRLGVTLNIVATTWATMMADLDARCDVAMGGVSITLDRAEQAFYSTPYLRDGKAAVVRCGDQAKYQTLDNIDQPGVRVVVNPSGTNDDFDKTHIHRATIVNYPDNNTIFGQVIGNNADVMVTDASEIGFQIKQDPRLCGVSLDHPFTFEQKAYLIAQRNVAMQQWIDQWLNIAENDGTFAAISQKWLG